MIFNHPALAVMNQALLSREDSKMNVNIFIPLVFSSDLVLAKFCWMVH